MPAYRPKQKKSPRVIVAAFRLGAATAAGACADHTGGPSLCGRLASRALMQTAGHARSWGRTRERGIKPADQESTRTDHERTLLGAGPVRPTRAGVRARRATGRHAARRLAPLSGDFAPWRAGRSEKPNYILKPNYSTLNSTTFVVVEDDRGSRSAGAYSGAPMGSAWGRSRGRPPTRLRHGGHGGVARGREGAQSVVGVVVVVVVEVVHWLVVLRLTSEPCPVPETAKEYTRCSNSR